MRKFIITILILLNLPANAQLNTRIVENELSKLVNDGKLVSNDILNWITTDNTFSNENGINHFYIRQGKNNLEINGTESGIHILSDGTVLTSNINFIKNLDSKITGLSIPNISAIQAVKNVALELGYTVTEQLTVLERNNTVNQKQLISQGGISSSKIPVRLMYHRLQNDNVVLVWDLSIESSQKNEWYNLKVDASTGVIVDKINWMLTCDFPVSKIEKQSNFVDKIEKWNFTKFLKNENFLSPNSILSGTYNVFGLPLESPYYGSRSLVTNIENLNASPYGWHDTNGILGAEYTVTRGNNVNAFKGSGTSLFQPNGGPNLVFDYPLNLAFSTTTPSEAASITNLFYYNNIIHDVMYNYGFGEINGNFQTLNYNSGSGLGNDPVNARAQIRNWGNATFSTPPDGTSPSMSMYYNGTQDGNLENLVIAHEYGHGISNRLTGGPTNVSCLDNNEQMGEGWSDWYGLMLSMEAGDTNTTSRTVGNYLFNQGINGSGIRPFPYNTMMTVNPQTYNAIKTAAIPHGVGSVWCTMLWEMTWSLIDVYGFDSDFYTGTGGNNKALKIVTLALKLQPCSPGFVDGRNAILAADQALYNGANQCLIWDAFAKRGLGYSALQNLSSSSTDGVEAYDLPAGQCSCPANLNINTIVVVPDIYTRQASATITASNIINSGARAIYHAGQSVLLTNGFVAKNGSSFRAYIEGCTNIFVGRNSSQTENTRVAKNSSVSNSNKAERKIIYPNPVDNKFFIEDLNSLKSVIISDIRGKKLIQLEYNDEFKIHEIDISSFEKGIYIVSIETADGKVTNEKLIKN